MTQQEETPRQVLRRVLAVWRCLAVAEKAHEAELLAQKPDLTKGETPHGSFSTHRIRHEVTESANRVFKESGAAK